MCNFLYIHRIALDIYIYTLKIYNTISHWEGELDGRGHTGRREALRLISFSKVHSRVKRYQQQLTITGVQWIYFFK